MNKWVRGILMVVLLAVFLFSGGTVLYVQHEYKVNDALYEDLAAAYVQAAPGNESAPGPGEDPEMEAVPAEDRLAAPIRVDLKALREKNPDVIGWLYCEDTPINYPVLQGPDDDYYLHRGLDGRYSIFGSLFAEAQNRPDFQDANTIIYGHHMKNGSMFACLENWSKPEYYRQHKTMWLLTEERDYQIVLEAGYTTDAYASVYTVFSGPGAEFDAYLAEALARSNFQADTAPDSGARWIVLSTCAYAFDNARYVLHGMLVPADSAGGVPLRPEE